MTNTEAGEDPGGSARTKAASAASARVEMESTLLNKIKTLKEDDLIKSAKSGLVTVIRSVFNGDIAAGASNEAVDLIWKLQRLSDDLEYGYASEAAVLVSEFKKLMKGQANGNLFDRKLKAQTEADGGERGSEALAIVARINKSYSCAQKGATYKIMALREGRGDGRTPKFAPMDVRQFHLASSDRFVDPSLTGGKRKTEHQYWLEDPNHTKYRDVVFAPGAPEQPNVLNYWSGFMVVPFQIKGFMEKSLFIKHIKENVTQGNAEHFSLFFGWFAHTFQSPQEKKRTTIVISGESGAGKSLVAYVFGKLMGEHCTKVSKSRDLLGTFNSHLAITKLIIAEEAVYATGKDGMSALKDFITSEYGFIEHKGHDKISVRNYADLCLISDGEWFVHANFARERRFAVFEVSSAHVQDKEYFDAIVKEMDDPANMAALLYELLNFDLTKIDVNKVIKTDALLKQKLKSLDIYGKYIYQFLDSGELPNGFNEVEGKQYVLKSTVFAELVNFKQAGGDRSEISEASLTKAFLKYMAAGITIARKRRIENGKDQSGNMKGQYFVFEPLQQCRDAFCGAAGQRIEEWKEDEALAEVWHSVTV